jgi:hypothetical protein
VVAGLNFSCQVWRFNYIDDSVGGAVPSGTMVYDNVQARRIERPSYKMLAGMQGLESERYELFELYPATIIVLENDEITITNPPNHWDYHQWFRVMQIKRVGFHPSDPRGYLFCSCKRSVEAHAIQ